MILFILAIFLLLLALLSLTLEKTYFYLPVKELKRQAVVGDELASTLFKAAAYGMELKLLLWLITGLSAAGSFVLLARLAPSIFGFVAVVLLVWLAFVWLPKSHVTMVGARVSAWSTPVVVWLLRSFHPVLQFPAFYAQHFPVDRHTGLYEQEDVLELIEQQKQQTDSRLDERELQRMRNALQFSNYHVRDIVVPRSQVKAINVNEMLGPVLLSELHSSGYSFFPVYEDKPTNIIGTLAIKEVADVRHERKVRDFVKTQLSYVHEADSLEQALQAFFNTKQHLFIVVSSANDYVGIITVSNILQQLVALENSEAFDRYDDRQAVASRYDREQTEESGQAVELSDSSSEVIE